MHSRCETRLTSIKIERVKKTTRTTVKPELKRRLEIIRTTVRVLTPAQLARVDGGDGDGGPTNCDCNYTLFPQTGDR